MNPIFFRSQRGGKSCNNWHYEQLFKCCFCDSVFLLKCRGFILDQRNTNQLRKKLCQNIPVSRLFKRRLKQKVTAKGLLVLSLPRKLVRLLRLPRKRILI